ncbi:hypothetical protein Sulac_0585 [Sulfobacillus acidophilus DSM 10332]|uniref:Uncharacterized protein n=1 Tax=Sulfobacillus acidophilus (strain ATCC 700253 / DSM 10332 / NAL) TaxID=679936 RepID=G8TZE5_SULAD|nr:hypothetical protein Sulac_0585 [Sulfobacillus acidophilus DSM 10332]
MQLLAKIVLVIGMVIFIIGRFMGHRESTVQMAGVVIIFVGAGLAMYSVRKGRGG